MPRNNPTNIAPAPAEQAFDFAELRRAAIDSAHDDELSGVLARQYCVRHAYPPETLAQMRHANATCTASSPRAQVMLSQIYARWEQKDSELHRFIYHNILDLRTKELTPRQVSNIKIAIGAELLDDTHHEQCITMLFGAVRFVERKLNFRENVPVPPDAQARLAILQNIADHLRHTMERLHISQELDRGWS